MLRRGAIARRVRLLDCPDKFADCADPSLLGLSFDRFVGGQCRVPAVDFEVLVNLPGFVGRDRLVAHPQVKLFASAARHQLDAEMFGRLASARSFSHALKHDGLPIADIALGEALGGGQQLVSNFYHPSRFAMYRYFLSRIGRNILWKPYLCQYDVLYRRIAEHLKLGTLNHWVVGSIPTRCRPQRQRVTFNGLKPYREGLGNFSATFDVFS